MTLRIRRGLEADRASITPASGELIYTTDSKSLYIGDNTTAGGVIASNGQGATANDMPRYERTLATTSVTAGSFVIGTSYTITFVGSTNFTLIGASSNTVGLSFTATGVGTGSGTAMTSGGNALHTALRLVKRVPAATNFDNDLGGPAINFLYQYGDATVAAQTVALLGARYQGVGTSNNHSFQYQLLSGGSGTSYDTVLNLSRLKADFDVPIRSKTFSTTTTRNSHYAAFTDPDADPQDGDITFVTDAGNGRERLEVYTDAGTNAAKWHSLLTQRFAGSDPAYMPIFTREESGAETATTVMRVIRRRTDDTVNTNDRVGPSIRFEFAHGAYDTSSPNETTFGFIGSVYRPTTNDHEMVFSTQDNSTSTVTTHFSSSRKRFQFNTPAKLVVYANTTARDAAVTSPEAGMMIYLDSTDKVQVYNGSAWVDLH